MQVPGGRGCRQPVKSVLNFDQRLPNPTNQSSTINLDDSSSTPTPPARPHQRDYMATLTASQPKTIDHDLSRSTGAATTCDVLVIGAGIAGCGIASALAKQGRRVIVVERNLDEPDRIVGELLQPGGVAALRRLGLEHCLEGIEATPVEGYHLYWKDDQATFWFCPVPAGEKGSLDRPTGRSFHHGKFVGRLRAAVAREPNATLVETTAVELLRDRRTGTVTGAVCSLLGNPTHEVRTEDSLPTALLVSF